MSAAGSMASLAKKGGAVQLRVAQRPLRDLIVLTLQIYSDPGWLATLPIDRGGGGGGLSLAIPSGSPTGPEGPPSPTSSIAPSENASEQPSVADSDATARKTSLGKALGGRRTLSFGRKPKGQ